jgi:uncharacterized protein (DUF58 family)
MLVGFGGLLLVSFIWLRLLAGSVGGSRRLRFGWVAVGDRLSEQFQLVNNGPLPAFWVEVVDHSNVPGYAAGIVQSVGPGQTTQWRKSAVCQQRGQYRLGPWHLRLSDPFGIFTVELPMSAGDEIIIHPPTDALLPVPLPVGRSSGRARSRLRDFQATVNASAVREYQPGDPLRWIHWPTSARRDEFMVRQFDLDAAGDIWLLLDMQRDVQVGSGADGTEEQAVLTAAALAAQGLQRNRGVGLAGYGQVPRLLPPGHGQGQQWSLLRQLALIRADGDTPLRRALADLQTVVRRGAVVTVITPSASADWLPSLLALSERGIRCHPILLERASFAVGGASLPPPASSTTDSSLSLYDMLRRAGFDASLLYRGDIRRSRRDEDRRGFWEFRTTPTGKAIVVRRPDFVDAR